MYPSPQSKITVLNTLEGIALELQKLSLLEQNQYLFESLKSDWNMIFIKNSEHPTACMLYMDWHVNDAGRAYSELSVQSKREENPEGTQSPCKRAVHGKEFPQDLDKQVYFAF